AVSDRVRLSTRTRPRRRPPPAEPVPRAACVPAPSGAGPGWFPGRAGLGRPRVSFRAERLPARSEPTHDHPSQNLSQRPLFPVLTAIGRGLSSATLTRGKSMKIRTAVAVVLATALAACSQMTGGGLQPGQQVTGTLEASETKSDQGGAVADVYQLNGRQGERYAITLTSEAFDAYLYVRGPGALAPDNDDDGSGSYNSRLNIIFPEDGVAQVYVTSFSRNATGAYQLQVERTGEATEVAQTTTPGQAPPIAAQQHAGTL